MNTITITSPRQRKFATVGAVVALLAAMLPAIRVPLLGSVSLIQGGDGVLTLIALLFVIGGLFWSKEIATSIQTYTKKDIPDSSVLAGVVVLIALILVRIAYLWYNFTFLDVDLRNDAFGAALAASVGPTYGLYFTAIALIFVLGCLFFFKKIDETSLRIEKKLQKEKE